MQIQLNPPLAINERGKRTENEDSVFPKLEEVEQNQTARLFMVCDGVGGAAKGKEASNIACATIGEYLGAEEEVDQLAIAEALRITEKRIDEYITKVPEADGMATTLALLHIGNLIATVAHVGDSRVYHFRQDQILFRTKDHSLVQELLDKKVITAKEAFQHPNRNVVTRSITSSRYPAKADVKRLSDIKEDDHFFLCSDGVLESVSDEDLASLIGRKDLSGEEKIKHIHRKCSENSKDNFSAYLISIKIIRNSTSLHATTKSSGNLDYEVIYKQENKGASQKGISVFIRWLDKVLSRWKL